VEDHGFAAKGQMPATEKQHAQRERFLAAYFDGPEELRGNLKASALAAGYSKTTTIRQS
jgi:hypothetical protein